MVRLSIFGLIFLVFLVTACQTGRENASFSTTRISSVTHPELSAQEKLTPCSSCHREVTPEIYEEWFNSRHGLDNVKCFQCHGTYENFELYPSAGRCAACHAREVAHAPKDKACWACHPAHKFSVHH